MSSHANAPTAGPFRIFAGIALVALLLLGAAGDRAVAATGRPYLETIPTTGDVPAALTADAAGNLYLSNSSAGSPRVEKIDTAGNPVNFTASADYISGNKLLYASADTAVSKANGFIYLSRGYLSEGTGGEARVFAPSGENLGLIPAGQYICGVGVDPNSGDVYRSGLEDSVIPRYEVVGTNPADDVLTGRLKILAEYNGGCNVEVDSTGDVYISTGEGQLVRFTQAEIGPPTGNITAVPGTVVANLNARATAVTVEPSTDNVFADVYDHGYEYGPGGALLVEYPALGGSAGAVFTGGKLYVSRTVGGIAVFGALTQLPIAKTEGVDDVHPDEVILHGEVDPDSAGDVTGCEFKWGTDQRYTGGSVACDTALPITSATAVDAQLGGLDPVTTYHYQLVLENGNGVQLGADRTFTTLPAVEGVTTGDATEVKKRTATLHGSFVGRGENVHYYFEYGTSSSFGQTVPAPPGNDAGSPTGQEDLAVPVSGLQGGTEYHYRLVATNVYGHTFGEERTFTTPPAVTALTTGPATGVTDISAELNGSFEADAFETHYYFEWGQTTAYGKVAPAPPGNTVPPGTGVVDLPPVTISGLAEGGIYHYRVVATNEAGTTYGADATFRSAEPPLVSNPNTRNVKATSAELTGEVNPRHGETTYQFEWGSSTGYGNSVPVPAGSAGSGDSGVPVSVKLEGLSATVTYHFRLVATNQYGTVSTPDQVFGFYPPSCPNSQVRQEVRANALPDCRAYELVSPTYAQGSAIMAFSAPSSGVATRPPRLMYSATWGNFEDSTGEPTSSFSDKYVSTRTSTGWNQRYVGIPSNRGVFTAGPPGAGIVPPQFASYTDFQRGTLATPELDKVIDYDWGFPGQLTNLGFASNAAYVWDATGKQVGRWPTNVGEVEEGLHYVGMPQASHDFSHFVFSSNLVFAPGGQESEKKVGYGFFTAEEVWPRDYVYDNEISTGAVVLASRKSAAKGGEPFQGRALAISEDGSRILIADDSTLNQSAMSLPPDPRRLAMGSEVTGPLYLRVDAKETIEFGAGHKFIYAGSTPDGRTVYLTSEEQLTADDHDSSRDIFVWHESDPGSFTRISFGDHGDAGDTDECVADEGWIPDCGAGLVGINSGAGGGNRVTDNYFATEHDDFYFESPEQLEGQRGDPGERNLYLYRNGKVRFVATLRPNAGVTRMQVTSTGAHMALVTASDLTNYQSGGRPEMYVYDPEGRPLICASCRPDAKPPVSDVTASQNGLFLTNDGRVFFITRDPLVARDTNENEDVYEFTEGKPHLITTGLGPGFPPKVFPSVTGPGLIGVSADGIDVYFATIDNLVTQDHNGAQVKIYDARTGGGFPAELEVPKCVAADECHGPSSSQSPLPPDRTSAPIGGTAQKKASKAKKKKAKKKKRKASRNKKAKKRKRGKRHG